MFDMRTKTRHRIKFWRRRVLPYPVKVGDMESHGVQHGVISSRDNVDGVGSEIFPRNKHFFWQAWYTCALSDCKIPYTIMLRNNLSCSFINYWAWTRRQIGS